MTLSAEALSLYRAALRASSPFSSGIKSKIRYNVREMFQFYRQYANQDKKAHLIAEGWHDVRVLRELTKLDSGIQKELLKRFDTNTEPLVFDHADKTFTPAIGECIIPNAEEADESSFEFPQPNMA